MFLWAAHADCGDNLLYGFAPYLCLHTIAECVSYASVSHLQLGKYIYEPISVQALLADYTLFLSFGSEKLPDASKSEQQILWRVPEMVLICGASLQAQNNSLWIQKCKQGKEEGWDWMVWLGSMTWCWFLVCVAVAVEWSWRNSQENEWMNEYQRCLGCPV